MRKISSLISAVLLFSCAFAQAASQRWEEKRANDCPQHPPIPGVHNSGWVQSPGADALENHNEEARFEAYVKGVVGAFAKDSRILAWDVWNEPSNTNGGAYGKQEPRDKRDRVQDLLP